MARITEGKRHGHHRAKAENEACKEKRSCGTKAPSRAGGKGARGERVYREARRSVSGTQAAGQEGQARRGVAQRPEAPERHREEPSELLDSAAGAQRTDPTRRTPAPARRT